MKTKQSLITDRRNGKSSVRAFFILLIMLLVVPVAVSAAGIPSVTSISPAVGTSDGGTLITITGVNLTGTSTVYIVPPTGGSPSAIYSSYMAATDVTVVSDTEVTAITPAVPSDDEGNFGVAETPDGQLFWGRYYDVIVINTAGSTDAQKSFAYVEPPTIYNIAPQSGPLAGGQNVEIAGKALTGASVTFGSTAGTISDDTNPFGDEIYVITPASSTAGTVTVTAATLVGSATISGLDYSYTYEAVPTITSITPTYSVLEGSGVGETYAEAYGIGGDHGGMIIRGTGFNTGDNSHGHVYVTFGPFLDGEYADVSAYVINSTALWTWIPPTHDGQPAIVNIQVTDAGGNATLANSLTYYLPPHVDSVLPVNGTSYGGQTVTITGRYFGNATSVRFDGINASWFRVDSVTQITAITPADPTLTSSTKYVSVDVTTFADVSQLGDQFYTYEAPTPTFTSLTPASGPVAGNTSVTITGTNLKYPLSVTFGGNAGTITANSTSAITVLTPISSTAGAVDVVITTAGGALTETGAFNYTATHPVISTISPIGGPLTGGNTLIITGSSFTAAINVTFGTTSTTDFSVINDTYMTVTVPAGSGEVPVSVYGPGGYGSYNNYLYGPTPTLTSISPTTGSSSGGDTVVLTGSGYSLNSSSIVTDVKFGKYSASSFAYLDDGNVSAVTPAGVGGSTCDVTIFTKVGSATLIDAFTYDANESAVSTMGVFRNGTWYLASANQNSGGSVTKFQFGATDGGDVPLAGNWNGNGDTVGVFRSNGQFFLSNSNTNNIASGFLFGTRGDVPIAGDWNGDGVDTVGVFRNGTFFLASANQNSGSSVNSFTFGADGDTPLVWHHDGMDTVGVFRNGVVYLASENVNGGGTVTYFTYGKASDAPVNGIWA